MTTRLYKGGVHLLKNTIRNHGLNRIDSKRRKVTTLKLKRNLKRKFEDGTIITFFLAPALIIYLVYVVYSIMMTFYYSLFKWSGIEAASDLLVLQIMFNY